MIWEIFRKITHSGDAEAEIGGDNASHSKARLA
jgi:hypothetical protein